MLRPVRLTRATQAAREVQLFHAARARVTAAMKWRDVARMTRSRLDHDKRDAALGDLQYVDEALVAALTEVEQLERKMLDMVREHEDDDATTVSELRAEKRRLEREIEELEDDLEYAQLKLRDMKEEK